MTTMYFKICGFKHSGLKWRPMIYDYLTMAISESRVNNILEKNEVICDRTQIQPKP